MTWLQMALRSLWLRAGILLMLGWVFGMGTAIANPGLLNGDQIRPTVQPLPTAVPTAMPTLVAPTPTAAPVAQHKQEASGAHILLQLASGGSCAGMRAVVQWLGRDSQWYDVEGWQSELTARDLSVRWWVAPNDFGKGPFRWAVYAKGATQPARTSPSFYLPPSNGAQVIVQLPD